MEAALYLATCNARPYSHHDWHWRLLVAHRFGHAASAPTVHGALAPARRSGHRRASWRCARSAAGGSRSRRCGAARSPRARSSAACGRSSDGARARARAATCCSARACRARWRGRPRVELIGDEPRLRARLATRLPAPSVLVVDLTDARARRRRRRGVAARRRRARARRARWPSTPTWTPPRASARSGRASTWWCRARAWRARAPSWSSACSARRSAAGPLDWARPGNAAPVGLGGGGLAPGTTLQRMVGRSAGPG